MHELYELKEMLCKELKEYGKKDKIDANSLEIIDKLSESVWRICRIIEHYENENGNYSNAGYSNNNSYRTIPRLSYGNSNASYANSRAMGRSNAGNSMSMGRYSSRESGYSNDDFRMDLQELAQNAPNDYVRQKMMDVMGSM